MRQRLSPRETIVVAILDTTTADDDPPFDSGVAAVACGGRRFATAVSGTSNGTSARDLTAPELDSTSSNATTTLCLDVACLPSGCLDLNVRSEERRVGKECR